MTQNAGSWAESVQSVSARVPEANKLPYQESRIKLLHSIIAWWLDISDSCPLNCCGEKNPTWSGSNRGPQSGELLMCFIPGISCCYGWFIPGPVLDGYIPVISLFIPVTSLLYPCYAPVITIYPCFSIVLTLPCCEAACASPLSSASSTPGLILEQLYTELLIIAWRLEETGHHQW